MSDRLGEMLGFDPEDELIKNATHMAENDYRLQMVLTRIRRESGLTRLEVGDRMGVPESQVEEFEAYWHDPKLSEIRRYALAVGATYTTEVSMWEQEDGGKP